MVVSCVWWLWEVGYGVRGMGVCGVWVGSRMQCGKGSWCAGGRVGCGVGGGFWGGVLREDCRRVCVDSVVIRVGGLSEIMESVCSVVVVLPC